MFRYLVEEISMSDTDTNVYCCEVYFIVCTMYVYVVLFPIDLTAIKCIIDILCLFICTYI